MTLLELRDVLKEVKIPVAHYESEFNEYPYIVYREFSSNYETASGKAYMENTRVEITHYTKTEFDPTLELLKKVLLKNNLIHTMSVTYDAAIGVIVNQTEVVIKKEMGLNV